MKYVFCINCESGPFRDNGTIHRYRHNQHKVIPYSDYIIQIMGAGTA